MPHVLQRGGRYYYSRRVPKKIRAFDPRDVIRISLETDSLIDAEKKSIVVQEQIENYWRRLIAAGEKHTDKNFHEAVEFARVLGFSYQPGSQLADAPLDELVRRLAIVKSSGKNRKHADALLGGIDTPKLTISEALRQYWTFTADRVMNKNPLQLRKWKNPRMKAVDNFIKIVGDKEITEITRYDMIMFRDWWIAQIKARNMSTISANKNIIHVKNIIETVARSKQIEINSVQVFQKIILEKRFGSKRLPFSSKQIVSMLKSKKLSGLNDEARWFLFAAAETGARPSEIVGLMPEDIRLSDKIPHIKITDRPNRPLKTAHSAREIPLVGYALEAFKANPEGFPRYRDKPDNLSNAVNKFLRLNGFFPSDEYSVYSLRHSFQDRILSVNAPDRIQASLMGHKFNRPMYGEGGSLKHKMEWMNKIKLG